LLENLGTATEEQNGKFAVTLGPETEVFEAPRGKDIDEQMAVDLRRMLKHAGFGPAGEAPVPDRHAADPAIRRNANRHSVTDADPDVIHPGRIA
jgi:hypothetical protein